MGVARDAPRRRIYLMRHGDVTYFDAEGRPVRPDGVALNATGQAQADAAGEWFARAGIRFDRVVVSGLARTVETAERVLAKLPEAPAIEAEHALREIEGGRLQDIPPGELRHAFTGAFDGVARESTRFLGGESIGELFDRVTPAIDRLRSDGNWDVLLAVLHGGVNRAVLSWLLTGQRLMLGGLHQSPACINALDIGVAKEDVVLRLANFTATDPLQTRTRKTTMEALLEQYQRRGDCAHV
jgi:probable phosphoglycerate mutase